MPKLDLADRKALREKLLVLAESKKKTFIQCRDKEVGTFYKCQLVSAKRHARGIRLTLNRVIDSCHWIVSFYRIDNITFITKTKAHQKPHAWSPSPPSSQVKSTPQTVQKQSRVTRVTRVARRSSHQSPEVTSSAADPLPLVSSRTAIAQALSFSPLSPTEVPFSELPLTSPLQLSVIRTPRNTANSHDLIRTPAPRSPYGFGQTFSDLAKIASESLPRTNSIEAADRGAYVDLTNSPPTPVPTIQMVCKHGCLGKCPRCAALDLSQHADI